MSKWTPCKRRDFIKKLKKLGFDGIYSGSKHQFMIFKEYRLTIPFNDEYSVPQIKMLIKEIEQIIERSIELDEWLAL
ncbi:MAG: type II toxin-antitoxin system HicA family toxin [Spirochaetota bacterium]